MKKSIWKVTLVIVFALMVGLNVYNVQKTDMEMSELALANVEALAGNEGG
ncbi:NVEALA domain-containing protein, partial [uncultured Phocaeicola sp.]